MATDPSLAMARVQRRPRAWIRSWHARGGTPLVDQHHRPVLQLRIHFPRRAAPARLQQERHQTWRAFGRPPPTACTRHPPWPNLLQQAHVTTRAGGNLTAPSSPIIVAVGDTNEADSSHAVGQAGRWSLGVESFLTASLGAMVFVIGFGWDLRRLADPLGTGDMLQPYVTAKLWGDGSPFGNNTLGYPFGMDLRYFPTADVAQNTLAGIIAAISRNPFLGINVVHALSFPLVAVAALWVFRLAGVRGPIAIVSSLAFTAIPFHWLRLEHFYLGTIYSAVIAVGLAILTGTGGLSQRLTGRRRRSTIALLLVLTLIVATSGIYYACFAILLCAAALVYRIAHDGSRRTVMLSAMPAVGIVVWTAIVLAPAFVFVRANPPLQPVADRVALESVAYSGNLALLLTPAPLTYLPGLSSLNPRIESAFTTAAGSGQSGVSWLSNFGSNFTLAALIVAVIGLIFSIRIRERERLSMTEPVARAGSDIVSFGLVGTLLGTGILFFVPWGLNVVFAALVTPQIRAWDRLTPILLLLFFVGAMVTLRELRFPQHSRTAAVVSTVLLTLLIPDSVVPYQRMYATDLKNGSENYELGTRYATALNTAIPGDCGILQLPYTPYPEFPPINRLETYDGFWAPLTNPGKRWTYGATKGTIDSHWLEVLGAKLDANSMSDLRAAGFCGVHVDSRGYNAQDAELVAARLISLLGAPVATGHAGDWTAWAIPGDHAEAVAAAKVDEFPVSVAEFFHPPDIEPSAANPLTAENSALSQWWWTESAVTTFDVHSSTDSFAFQTVEGTIIAAPCAGRDVTLELRSGDQVATELLHLDSNGSQSFRLDLPSGATVAKLVVRSSGAACQTKSDSRTLYVALANPNGE